MAQLQFTPMAVHSYHPRFVFVLVASFLPLPFLKCKLNVTKSPVVACRIVGERDALETSNHGKVTPPGGQPWGHVSYTILRYN